MDLHPIHSERLTERGRQRCITAIERLARKYGGVDFRSGRAPFNEGTARTAPELAGVYRIYLGDELQYIGKSGSLAQRLMQHLRNSHNDGMQPLIESGAALVEWYVCPLAGWQEDHELSEYRREHGHLPPLNRRTGAAALTGLTRAWVQRRKGGGNATRR